MEKKSCYTLCHLSLSTKQISKIYDAVGITDSDTSAIDSTCLKCHAASHFNCHSIINIMVPLKFSLASHDVNANGVTWSKYHVTPHFDHLSVINKMVPLMLPLASWDTDASANSIAWLKILLHIDITKAVVPLMMLLSSCAAIAVTNGITLPKLSCCTSF